MWVLPGAVKIYLALGAVDMRKGFDGLSGLVRQWGGDLYTGHLFVFVSRRGDRIKVLTWDRGGFVLWYKRLERGRFMIPEVNLVEETLELDSGQLWLLLDGIDFRSVKRRMAWVPRKDEKNDPQSKRYVIS